MCPGFDSRTRRHMWVEFVVGSLLRSERFFSGYSDFPLSSKTNIPKFHFDLDYCQALYHERLARVIAQALLVFDIKFTFTPAHFHWLKPIKIEPVTGPSRESLVSSGLRSKERRPRRMRWSSRVGHSQKF